MKPEATTNDAVAKVLGDENLLYEVLKRADGHSLASAECMCRECPDIAREEKLWELICRRHLANIGFNDQQPHSGILALGGFRSLHTLYLWPLSKMSTYLVSPFPCPLTCPSWWFAKRKEVEYRMASWAEKIGNCFSMQYYEMLEKKNPRLVQKFYNYASTVIHVDGNTRQTATGVQQIDALFRSVDYSGIEFNTEHSLESYNKGILVMRSGSLLRNGDLSGARRKFMHIFLIVPCTGYYFVNVLNEILQVNY